MDSAVTIPEFKPHPWPVCCGWVSQSLLASIIFSRKWDLPSTGREAPQRGPRHRSVEWVEALLLYPRHHSSCPHFPNSKGYHFPTFTIGNYSKPLCTRNSIPDSHRMQYNQNVIKEFFLGQLTERKTHAQKVDGLAGWWQGYGENPRFLFWSRSTPSPAQVTLGRWESYRQPGECCPLAGSVQETDPLWGDARLPLISIPSWPS